MNNAGDLISRQAAINALWKALYAYEDKTEKQFQESDELDVYDWIQHRIFVQNMSDIDRQTILELPDAQPDNQVNLCDSCKHTYPECPSVVTDVIFGTGKGNDNICACNKYEPSSQPEDWLERNKERILQAGMEGREIEFRIDGRLFAIREKAQ